MIDDGLPTDRDLLLMAEAGEAYWRAVAKSLEVELAVRDAKIAAWLRAKAAPLLKSWDPYETNEGYGYDNAADMIEAGAYRDDGDAG